MNSSEKVKAFEIVWGDGKVRMNSFKDHADGSFGLVLSHSDEGRKVGEVVDGPDEPAHMPQPGEVYLRFKNKAGLRALIYSLVDLVTEDEATTHG